MLDIVAPGEDIGGGFDTDSALPLPCPPPGTTIDVDLRGLTRPGEGKAFARSVIISQAVHQPKDSSPSHQCTTHLRQEGYTPVVLREIDVHNLAVIDAARLELSGRMAAITGETGAGKSLVVDAIGLALGDRADTGLIGSAGAKAVVSIVFQTNCADAEDGCLLLSRDISDGRSQCRTNGRPITSAEAKEIGERLVDLHGQHEHQRLLSPAAHRDLLDAWIGEDALSLRRSLSEIVTELREIRDRIESLRERGRERERLIDLYRYELKEIGDVGPADGEDEELESERRRMQNSAKLATDVEAASRALSQEDGSAQECLSAALAATERCAEIDEALRPALETLQSAIANAEETSRALAAYAGRLEFDPERLEVVAERLDQIGRLKRKYGATVAEIHAYAEKTGAQLAELESSDETQGALEARAVALEKELMTAAASLTKLRNEAAERFGKLVTTQVQELAMEHALFTVGLTPKEPDSTGAESVEFLFTANPGHPARGLAKIASGGELSRVMLAIRCVQAGASPAPTLVFDEVDAGLGGQTAIVVGKKLKELSNHSQVIVITHLPQIAGQADEQFHVSKSAIAGKTHVEVRRLEGDDRVTELARMLGGDAVASVAIEHARELLAGFSKN